MRQALKTLVLVAKDNLNLANKVKTKNYKEQE